MLLLHLLGLVLLFASGIQIYWSIFKLKYPYSSSAKKDPDEDDEINGLIKILCWYFGAILGSIVAVYLVAVLSKQKIYVIQSCSVMVKVHISYSFFSPSIYSFSEADYLY